MAERRLAMTKMKRFRPYTKQLAFFQLGASHPERLLMAANRFGKTECGAFEITCHLTGLYPHWWNGRRFHHPIDAWVGGVTNESARDVVQEKLLGPPAQRSLWGSGMIPQDALQDISMARGVADLVDTINVRHVSGGVSSVQIKSYERGREKWQGTGKHAVWMDEEPPQDIYTEARTRTLDKQGIVLVTFTPLLGMSEVVRRFLLEVSPQRAIVTATIDDAEHFSAEQRQAIVDSYAPHEREARTKGIPTLGSGRIFPVEEAAIVIQPIVIQPHWPRIGGLDFGWDHPTSAIELAWDRDKDVVYLTKDYRVRQTLPALHTAALKPWGKSMPWSWPHDGLITDKTSGIQVAEQYRDLGLNMLPERATFSDGTNGVEAGLIQMLERMQTNRWKVFSTCGVWLEEFRLYHREDGKVVKEYDDTIDASRYAYMMLRMAEVDAVDRAWTPKIRRVV
jgi:phage terminase large subunit-like protein